MTPPFLLAEARFAEHLAALIDASREHLDRHEAWAAELAEVPAARAMLQSGMAVQADCPLRPWGSQPRPV